MAVYADFKTIKPSLQRQRVAGSVGDQGDCPASVICFPIERHINRVGLLYQIDQAQLGRRGCRRCRQQQYAQGSQGRQYASAVHLVSPWSGSSVLTRLSRAGLPMNIRKASTSSMANGTGADTISRNTSTMATRVPRTTPAMGTHRADSICFQQIRFTTMNVPRNTRLDASTSDDSEPMIARAVAITPTRIIGLSGTSKRFW